MAIASVFLRVVSAPFALQAADSTLRATQVALALTVGFWVIAGPFPPFYPEEELLLYEPEGAARLIPALGTANYELLRWAVAISCVGMLFALSARVATAAAAATFFILNGYVSGFSALWNYNTHLNLFLIALAFARLPSSADHIGAAQRNSAILFFMRFQVAVIYFQAGLAKLVLGGIYWPLSTPYIHLVLQESSHAAWLPLKPEVVAGLAYLVVAAELVLPILFLINRTQVSAVALATALHISFYVTLGIGFWHLWMLFPALFLYGRAVLATQR